MQMENKKTPPTKINSNRLNFQRPISDLHQSYSISEKWSDHV